MGLARRTWTAALAAAAIGGTGIGVAAASGPSGDDTPARPASSTSAPGVLDDDGTADRGSGDRPATPLPTGSASATSGRHCGDDDGTADRGRGDRGGAASSAEPGDDRSGHRGGDDDHDDDRSGHGDDDHGDDD